MSLGCGKDFRRPLAGGGSRAASWLLAANCDPGELAAHRFCLVPALDGNLPADLEYGYYESQGTLL